VGSRTAEMLPSQREDCMTGLLMNNGSIRTGHQLRTAGMP